MKVTKIKKQSQIEGRRDKIMELTMQGYSEHEIAKMIGFAQSTVERDIKVRLQMHAKYHHDTTRVRMITINRLENLLKRWWTAAGSDPIALKNCLEIVDKIARFSGVAPAQKMELNHTGAIESKIEKKVRVEFVETDKKTIINGDSVEIVERASLPAESVSEDLALVESS